MGDQHLIQDSSGSKADFKSQRSIKSRRKAARQGSGCGERMGSRSLKKRSSRRGSSGLSSKCSNRGGPAAAATRVLESVYTLEDVVDDNSCSLEFGADGRAVSSSKAGGGAFNQ